MRKAADSIRQLVEHAGVDGMCSPRRKESFPEDHPQFVGVTGFAGHKSVLTYMQEHYPQPLLVLGTCLGELIYFWETIFLLCTGRKSVEEFGFN